MNDFEGRYPRGEIALWAVRRYCRYAVSYRNLEATMIERGVAVDHSTISRRVQRFAPKMEKRLRRWRRRPVPQPSQDSRPRENSRRRPGTGR